MNLPPPALLLRHREPALLLEAVEAFDGGTLRCTARGDGPWHWAEMLEGAAQTAGLLAGLQGDGPGVTAVIAEYRAIRVRVATHTGPIHFVARLERRILTFWRCAVEARDAGGTTLIDGRITVSPRRG